MVGNTIFGPKILDGLARVGHATRGLVYLFLGVLATVSALNKARPPSLAGAFSIIDHLPGGWIVLLATALGLCALSGWRLTQALLDLQGCGWRLKGLVQRAGSLIEAVLYAGPGVLATVIALSQNTKLSMEIREEATFAVEWTARILDWPLGHWIVGAVGLGGIGLGCSQFVKARGAAFDDIQASDQAMVVIRLVGWTGFAAKGMIFAATGILFLVAAWQVEASGVGGMRAAMTALANIPLGASVLLAVSMGLMVYGVFSLIKAWLHKPVRL